MTVEFWNATWSFLSLVVFALTAIAALAQLRHVRASNQIAALMSVRNDFTQLELQQSLRFVQDDLAGRLEDPAYRRELSELGFVDLARHPELHACNWFQGLGTLAKNGLVDEDALHELFGRLVDRNWELLAPVIALMRRRRGPTQYQNFEYLVARYRRWRERNPQGRYPAGTPRLDVVDRYVDAPE